MVWYIPLVYRDGMVWKYGWYGISYSDTNLVYTKCLLEIYNYFIGTLTFYSYPKTGKVSPEETKTAWQAFVLTRITSWQEPLKGLRRQYKCLARVLRLPSLRPSRRTTWFTRA